MAAVKTPTFPASSLTTDQLMEAWELNSVDHRAEVESHRQRGTLSEDGSSYAERTYRYTKAGERVLDKETWVPVVEAPLTPEDLWGDLSGFIGDMEDAEGDGEDATAPREAALQAAMYGINFLLVASGVDIKNPNLNRLPKAAFDALAANAAATQARAATDDARTALARGLASISKVRKLEEAETAAAQKHLYATLYAADSATGWRASKLDVQSPALASLIRTAVDAV